MKCKFFSFRRVQAMLAAATLSLAITGAAVAQTETPLYSFMQGTNPTFPVGGVIRDSDGNLFGTTYYGETSSSRCPNGCGTVFKLSPAGALTILHIFSSAHDGAFPSGRLARDLRGNLYGTTESGGTSNFGTVYRITANEPERALHSFAGGADGAAPMGGVLYVQGTLYGVTRAGGDPLGTGGCGTGGCGTVYKITSNGAETVLHAFGGDTDGKFPEAGLIMDPDGNLYGTTESGGANGVGTVFKIDTTGTESVIYSFAGGADGANPASALVRGTIGDLYGTTLNGGLFVGSCTSGCGTAFHIDPSGVKTTLVSFAGGSKGANPGGGLVRDSKGNFYGTTSLGGLVKACKNGCGTIYEITRIGTFISLHSFAGSGNNEGQLPQSGMITDGAGNFYGTTSEGGSFNGGEVYQFTP